LGSDGPSTDVFFFINSWDTFIIIQTPGFWMGGLWGSHYIGSEKYFAAGLKAPRLPHLPHLSRKACLTVHLDGLKVSIF
jgi:hypothetical protein